MTMPPQEELRRRLRAARLLADVTIAELAERLPAEAEMGERVLRKLEAGETRLKPQALRELASALGFPYVWFTVDDVRSRLTNDKEVTDLRLAQLERDFNTRLDELEARLAQSNSRTADDQSQPTAQDPRPARARRAPRSSRPGSGR